MYSRKDILDILEMAVLAGRILLENGAETYRVGETIQRLCRAKGLGTLECFTIPTGIFVSVSYGDEMITKVVTVQTKGIDLEIIALINDFSRKFVAEPMGVAEAVEQLKIIENSPHYPFWLQVVAGGIGGSFFAILFGSKGIEFPLSFITAAMVMIAYEWFDKMELSTFIKYVLCGCVNTLSAMLLTVVGTSMGYGPRMEMLAIGALMPLLPGVAITNSIRDIISGDYMSGMSRMLEVMVIAVGIALGVGIALNLNLYLRAVNL